MKNGTILVDNREPVILTIELTYLGYQVENVFLDAGDFEGKTIIGEIKRNADFYRSIIDQRIYYQPHKMIQTGKDCYWIIAGDPTDERRHLSLVLDILLQLVLNSHITVVPVPNNEAAIAYAIHTIMQRKDKKRSQKTPRETQKKLHPAQNITWALLQLLPGIGEECAKTIIKQYPTIAQLTHATLKELEALPTIGRKRALRIHNALRGKNTIGNHDLIS
ncbi:MAG: helix-hairpin-helix domain-containing protein [Promethearchaeota archaeon]